MGNPGGGKSTLAQKLCYELSTHYSERIFSGRNNVTPIMVILRDYGSEKKNHDRSILEFIQAKAKAEFQLQPPSGAFEYLLSNGRAMVIFDGLDELLDTRDRQEVSKAVEAFCTLYPSVPVLVTSREVGYEQAPLDGEVFEIFRLANFNEYQIKEYVTKWFNVITDSVSEKKKLKAEAFLEESQMVPDLRTNPLMLSLLCNIYQEENYIPTNRPDVYEKCANMLFERWDRSRGINVNLSFDIHLRPTMTYLAHWIYSSENLRGGITEEKLISKTTEYLRGKLLEDEAQKVAREFIEFCKGRAWVFTNTGSTKYGEELYQFTHQTFLEYFTAIYLCRNNPTPAKLLKVLRPRIIKREWDVIAQLAFQKQSRDLEGAGNYLLATLLKQAETSEIEKWNILSFAARCLEFMIPGPYIIQEIISLCIKHSILWGVEHSSKKYSKKKNAPPKPEEIFNYLLNSASDNRKIVAIQLENQIIAHAKSDNELEAVMVLEIGIQLQSIYNYSHQSLYLRTKAINLRKSDAGKIWNTVSNRIIADCSDQLKKFSERHLSLCLVSQRKGLINLAEIATWHGVVSIFRTIHSTMLPSINWTPLADLFLSWNSHVEQYHPNVARQIGSIILNNPPPWFKDNTYFTEIGPYSMKEYLYYQPQNSTQNTLEYDADTLFGYFTLLMVFVEALYVSNRRIGTTIMIDGKSRTIEINIIKDIKNSIHPIMHSIRWILIARYKHSNTAKDLTASILEKVQLELDKCNFTSEQQKFIWLWVKREISLF